MVWDTPTVPCKSVNTVRSVCLVAMGTGLGSSQRAWRMPALLRSSFSSIISVARHWFTNGSSSCVSTIRPIPPAIPSKSKSPDT
eukprot:804607-Rhodomonas_salina.1